MKPKRLLKSMLASVGLLCASLVSAADRPNVLLIVADDLNCAIGPYGDTTAVTPNLNRLATDGLVFERA